MTKGVTCRIRLLGAFEVEVGGRPVAAWASRRAAELVKILALADGHRRHREQIMDALWPDLDAEAAAANLRKAVHFARRSLGSEGAVVTEGQMVALWPHGTLRVDVDETRTPTDELLPEDRYAPWASEPRERIRMRALQELKQARDWQRVLAIDPADEEAHRALMRAALDAGDRRGAMRQFEQLRERLRIDLGLGPDAASVALYEEALSLSLEGADPPQPAEQIAGLLARGLVHLHSGEFAPAERLAADARIRAIDAALGREIGEASALLGMVANAQGRWKELFQREFGEWISSPAIASLVFDANLCLAEFTLSGPGSQEDIITYAHELLAIAEEAKSVHGRALAHLMLGEAALFADRLTDAERHLDEAAALHDEARNAPGRALALQRLGEVALARGQRWRARRTFERGLRLSTADPLAPHLVVRMHGALIESASSVEDALARVEVADAALEGASVCAPCSMGFRVAAATALARGGESGAARARIDEAERLAGMWPGGPWRAAIWEARGVLRTATGETATALFDEAATLYAELGRPRDAARCRTAALSDR